MKRSVCGVLSCLAVGASLGCSGDDIEAGAGGNGGSGGSGSVSVAEPMVTFTKDIHPILLAKCGTSGCHDMPNFITPGHGSADVNVAYTEATGMGSLGMPLYTRILARISSTTPSTIMPPSYANPPCEGALGAPGCVTQDEFDLIQEWVDQGHLK